MATRGGDGGGGRGEGTHRHGPTPGRRGPHRLGRPATKQPRRGVGTCADLRAAPSSAPWGVPPPTARRPQPVRRGGPCQVHRTRGAVTRPGVVVERKVLVGPAEVGRRWHRRRGRHAQRVIAVAGAADASANEAEQDNSGHHSRRCGGGGVFLCRGRHAGNAGRQPRHAHRPRVADDERARRRDGRRDARHLGTAPAVARGRRGGGYGVDGGVVAWQRRPRAASGGSGVVVGGRAAVAVAEAELGYVAKTQKDNVTEQGLEPWTFALIPVGY